MMEGNVCAGCNELIKDKYLLKAVGQLWHEDCLKCSCCDCRLGEVGSTLFIKANLFLCKRDYLRLFGETGQCSACFQPIPAFEMVMRAKEHVYHLECFACQQCRLRFCVGDRFYLYGNKIVCEDHHEEHLSNNSSETSQTTINCENITRTQQLTTMDEKTNNNGFSEVSVLQTC